MHEACECMTLRELKLKVRPTSRKRVPGKTTLILAEEPLEGYEGSGFRITVFLSGFALAESGKRNTVFRIDECGDYSYDFDNQFLDGAKDATRHDFPEEYFLDQPWPLRLLLTACDRLEANENAREGQWIGKHPAIPDHALQRSEELFEFENSLILRLDIERSISTLTLRQRQVLHLYSCGYTQEEVGMMLETSCSTISRSIQASKRKIAYCFSR